MPRKPRIVRPGVPLHVVVRGNDRIPMFRELPDRQHYLRHLRDASLEYSVDVHAYVLMTNHVHLLITPHDETGPSRVMQYIGRKYVGWFNHHYGRTGTLHEGRFRSTLVATARYFLACCRYIELNPVRAGMADDPADYEWSSHRANAFGEPDPLVTPHAVLESLAVDCKRRLEEYRDLFRQALSAEELIAIRLGIAGRRALRLKRGAR